MHKSCKQLVPEHWRPREAECESARKRDRVTNIPDFASFGHEGEGVVDGGTAVRLAAVAVRAAYASSANGNANTAIAIKAIGHFSAYLACGKFVR